jgi:hypothetical protein
VIVIDLRADAFSHDLLRGLRRERPEAPVVALIDPEASPSRAFSSGAVSVAPAEAMALSTCIINLSEMLSGVWRQAALRQARASGAATAAGAAAAGSAPLPNSPRPVKPQTEAETDESGTVASELLANEVLEGQSSTRITRQRGLRSSTSPGIATLDLMQSISSMTERAILFERNDDRLESAGAFGWSADGRPLAEVTRGLALQITEAGILARCLNDGEPCRVALDAVTLPEALLRRIGPPASGEVAILPVAAPDGRVVSIFYADNGALDAPLATLDALLTVAAELAPGSTATLRRPYSHAG